jgi:hypothetical protein
MLSLRSNSGGSDKLIVQDMKCIKKNWTGGVGARRVSLIPILSVGSLHGESASDLGLPAVAVGEELGLVV